MSFSDRLILEVQVIKALIVIETRRDYVFMISRIYKLETSNFNKIVYIMLRLKE